MTFASAASSSPTSDAEGSTLTVVLGSLAVFLIALELTIISVTFPELELAFDPVSRRTLSWVFTAYNIGVASFLLVAGWAAERHGRRLLFVSGMAVFGVGSLVSGLAPSIGVLIVGRVIQSIGGSMLIPASLALILHAVAPERRDVAIGVWGAMAGLAAAVGPTLGAVIVESAGWRWVFLLNVPIACVAVVAGRLRIAESRDPDIAPRVDVLTPPVGAAAVGLAVFVIVAGSEIGWTSLPALATMATAVALSVGFVWRSTHHRSPVFDPAIARLPTFVAGGVGTLLFVAGFTGWLVLAPTFLSEVWDYSTLRSGLAIAPGPLMMAVVAGPSGKLASRRGHALVVAGGALVAAAGVGWWLLTVGEDPAYLAAFLPGVILLGAGVGAGFPMLTAASMVEVPAHQYAMGAAGSTTARQLAMALGIAIAVAIVGSPEDATSDPQPFLASWAVAGALFAATAVVMAMARRAGHLGPDVTTIDLRAASNPAEETTDAKR